MFRILGFATLMFLLTAVWTDPVSAQIRSGRQLPVGPPGSGGSSFGAPPSFNTNPPSSNGFRPSRSGTPNPWEKPNYQSSPTRRRATAQQSGNYRFRARSIRWIIRWVVLGVIGLLSLGGWAASKLSSE